MRSAYIQLFVSLFLGLTSAQSPPAPTLPPCAQTCAGAFTAPGEVAGCNGLNINCICGNKAFTSSIACCLASQCDAADQSEAVSFAQTLCSENGVILPTAVSCLTGSSSASANSTGPTSTTTSRGLTATSSGSSSSGTISVTVVSTTSTKSTSTGGVGANNTGVELGLASGILAVLAFIGR